MRLEVTMGLMDKLRGRAAKAKQQAEQVADKHGDKIETGLDKASKAASRRTGHKYDSQIDKGVAKAKERLSKDDAEANEASAPPAQARPSTPDRNRDRGN
jgi:MT0933-like antitoxin protein